jgi:O-antigen ligase
VQDKLLGTGLGSAGFDIVARFDSWLFAMQVWWSHPIFGVGVGNFEKLEYEHEYLPSEWVQTGSTPQNAYVYLLALSGVVGFLSMLAILVGSVRSNLSLKRNPQFGLIALALAFALTTVLFASLTDDGPLFGPHAAYLVWFFIGLSEALRNLASQDRDLSSQSPKC